jgi:hypothetical protein
MKIILKMLPNTSLDAADPLGDVACSRVCIS